MKKTIQINIAGMVFNIEEDAYDKLSAYLRSIQQYFSSYEGSQEIVSDIEARIAEKFWNKQKNDNQQVITIENVNELVASMGTVSDFEAIAEEEDLITNKEQGAESLGKGAGSKAYGAGGSSTTTESPKRLYRDVRRKALGGVLAGLAHYFNMDVVWLRIIYLVLFFGLTPLLDHGGISGFLLIGYIICWIVFPPNMNIEEDEKIKKFYRNDDDKVIGGVSSGLAAYFGVDVTVIRLIFVLFGLFGAGIIAYIILWIVAPKAETLTQKMEMKGEPVTLENIETNIKQSLQEDKNAPENTLTKILLFPFRIIAMIFKGLGSVMKSLGPVARVFAGIILMAVSIGMMFAAMVSLGIVGGFLADGSFGGIGGDNPFSMIAKDIHPASGFFAALAVLMPLVALLLTGLILVSNKRIGSRNFWMTILSLWLVGIIGSGVIATKYAMNFRKEAKIEQTKNFALPASMLILDSKETDSDRDFKGEIVTDEVKVELQGYDGADLKLDQTFRSKGRTRQEAEENAKKIVYNLAQKDSALIFDRNIELQEKSRFRDQELRMKLFIPYNKSFKMTKKFYYNVYRRNWDDERDFDIDGDDVDKFTYMMKRDSGMVCLDCPKLNDEERKAKRENEYEDKGDGSFNYRVFEDDGQFKKEFSLKDFERVEAGGAFVVTIKKGNEFKIKADSDEQDNLEDLELKVRNNTLEIEYEDRFSFRRRERVRIEITMPTIKSVDFSGASVVKVIGFDDKSQDFEVDLAGASKAAIDIEARKIEFDASGASVADISGAADEISIDVSGACQVNARQLEVKDVSANASGASRVKFGKVSGNYRTDTSGASKVSKE